MFSFAEALKLLNKAVNILLKVYRKYQLKEVEETYEKIHEDPANAFAEHFDTKLRKMPKTSSTDDSSEA